MEKAKLQTITNLFENNEIRSIWNSEEEEYYYSVVDVIAALTNSDYQKSRNYWKWLKGKLHNEGSELVSITNQLKMELTDCKYYNKILKGYLGILNLVQRLNLLKCGLLVWIVKE